VSENYSTTTKTIEKISGILQEKITENSTRNLLVYEKPNFGGRFFNMVGIVMFGIFTGATYVTYLFTDPKYRSISDPNNKSFFDQCIDKLGIQSIRLLISSFPFLCGIFNKLNCGWKIVTKFEFNAF
jgi:hypothetical protein